MCKVLVVICQLAKAGELNTRLSPAGLRALVQKQLEDMNYPCHDDTVGKHVWVFRSLYGNEPLSFKEFVCMTFILLGVFRQKLEEQRERCEPLRSRVAPDLFQNFELEMMSDIQRMRHLEERSAKRFVPLLATLPSDYIEALKRRAEEQLSDSLTNKVLAKLRP